MLRFSTLAVVIAVSGCQPSSTTDQEAPAGAQDPLAALEVGSVEWKIQAYSSAAPASIASGATVLDWNDSLTAPTKELRAGTNGWTCFPLTPPPAGGYGSATEAAPMCGDAMTMAWAEGFMNHTEPGNEVLGLGYMLHGDMGASNIDPYASDATADNDWIVSGPHTMLFPADPARIDAITVDYTTGGPYLMWKGSPYAHIMVPTDPER